MTECSDRRGRGRGDTGAGALEYCLVAGLLLVGLMVSFRWVQSAGESALDRQAANIDYSGSGAGVPSRYFSPVNRKKVLFFQIGPSTLNPY